MFSFFKKDSYTKTLEAAQKANLHAKSIILKGYTQLESSYLDSNYSDHLRKGISGSDFSKIEGIGICDIIDEQINYRLKNGESGILAQFNSMLTVSAKFSLGNCDVLALHALDYIVRNFPTIEAELYKIGEGDHVFLVLNRNRNSEAHDPTTWGINAVICDPWANEVYPAKDCLIRLKNYVRDIKENKNKTEPYHPEKHFLMSYENNNTTVLRSEIKKEEIRQEQIGQKTNLS
jgi:hypothetical protein